MPNLFNDQKTLQSIRRTLATAVFLLVIWIPNLIAIQNYFPYLINTKTLQSNMLVADFAFLDTAKSYACAQIAKVAPQDIWSPACLQNWFKNYLKISKQPDKDIVNKVGYHPCTPQSVVMFMPLTNFPLNMVIIFLGLLTSIVLITPTTLLIRKHFNFSPAQIIYWWLIVLAAAPITINFYYGQLDGLLAGIAAIFLLTWQKKNSFPAAICMALTLAIKPQRAFIMLIMSLADRRFRLLFWALLISIILLGITINVLGLGPVLTYPNKLECIYRAIDNHQLPDTAYTTVSILGPISLICGLGFAHIMSLPATIVSLLGAYIIWHQAIQSGKHTYPFAYASSVLFIFIFAPLQHFYSLILLCVVWACTVPAISIGNILKIKEQPLRYWCFLFLFFPALTWIVAYLASLCGFPGLGHLLILLCMFFLSLSCFRQSIKAAH